MGEKMLMCLFRLLHIFHILYCPALHLFFRSCRCCCCPSLNLVFQFWRFLCGGVIIYLRLLFRLKRLMERTVHRHISCPCIPAENEWLFTSAYTAAYLSSHSLHFFNNLFIFIRPLNPSVWWCDPSTNELNRNRYCYSFFFYWRDCQLRVQLCVCLRSVIVWHAYGEWNCYSWPINWDLCEHWPNAMPLNATSDASWANGYSEPEQRLRLEKLVSIRCVWWRLNAAAWVEANDPRNVS